MRYNCDDSQTPGNLLFQGKLEQLYIYDGHFFPGPAPAGDPNPVLMCVVFSCSGFPLDVLLTVACGLLLVMQLVRSSTHMLDPDPQWAGFEK